MKTKISFVLPKKLKDDFKKNAKNDKKSQEFLFNNLLKEFISKYKNDKTRKFEEVIKVNIAIDTKVKNDIDYIYKNDIYIPNKSTVFIKIIEEYVKNKEDL